LPLPAHDDPANAASQVKALEVLFQEANHLIIRCPRFPVRDRNRAFTSSNVDGNLLA